MSTTLRRWEGEIVSTTERRCERRKYLLEGDSWMEMNVHCRKVEGGREKNVRYS